MCRNCKQAGGGLCPISRRFLMIRSGPHGPRPMAESRRGLSASPELQVQTSPNYRDISVPKSAAKVGISGRMKPQEGAQLCSSGVKGEGRSGSARPSHGAASGPVGGVLAACVSGLSLLRLTAHPTERRFGAVISDLHIPNQPELQVPAFPRVNPAEEVILEEVNLPVRPGLYTSVCTSSLRRPRREIRRSLLHAGRRGRTAKTATVGDIKDLDALKSAASNPTF